MMPHYLFSGYNKVTIGILSDHNDVMMTYVHVLTELRANIYQAWKARDLKDGWIDGLRFYVLFSSVSVISGRCTDDNGRLCAMEPVYN